MIIRHMTRRGGWAGHALLAAVLLVCTGCNINGPQSTAAELGQDLNTDGFGRRFASTSENEFTFGPGDSMVISVADTPEFSGVHVIRTDGRITLPLFNDVVAAGLSTNQLSQKLTTLFALYAKDPKVTVSVQSVVSKSFFIAARDPTGALILRKVPYVGDVVLIDVMAGIPISALADSTAVKIIRGDPREPVVHTINVKRIIMLGETGGNLQIRPDDIIMMPPTILGKLNIWLTSITLPFQGLFRATSTAVRLDQQVRILSGDQTFNRGSYYGYGGYGGY